MKKIFTLIIALMAIALTLRAEEPKDTSTPTPIILDIPPRDLVPNPKPLRSPIRIPVGAWYDAHLNTISILYYGEADGEANLYKDGLLIDCSSEINSVFSVSGSGLYTIEISTECWTVTGSIEI